MNEQEQLQEERKAQARKRINEVVDEVFELKRTAQVTIELTTQDGELDVGGLDITIDERVV